jgi:hypothetical protein
VAELAVTQLATVPFRNGYVAVSEALSAKALIKRENGIARGGVRQGKAGARSRRRWQRRKVRSIRAER